MDEHTNNTNNTNNPGNPSNLVSKFRTDVQSVSEEYDMLTNFVNLLKQENVANLFKLPTDVLSKVNAPVALVFNGDRNDFYLFEIKDYADVVKMNHNKVQGIMCSGEDNNVLCQNIKNKFVRYSIKSGNNIERYTYVVDSDIPSNPDTASNSGGGTRQSKRRRGSRKRRTRRNK